MEHHEEDATTVEKSNGTTCEGCGKALLKEDCIAYITQTKPHYFFFRCQACEKAPTEHA